MKCTYTERVYCEATRACPLPGPCPGHLVSPCLRLATFRLNHLDGWGQQYACPDHVDHPHFADYRTGTRTPL